MKKIIAIFMVLALVASTAFAQIAVTINPETNVWSSAPSVDDPIEGMYMQPGPDFLGELLASYSSEFGGGKLRSRFGKDGAWNDAANWVVDKYEAYIIPVTGVKLVMSKWAYEPLAENINWAPIFSSALFEATSDQFYTELTTVPNLTVAFGMALPRAAAKDVSDKPMNGFGALVKYDIENVGSVTGMFENRNNDPDFDSNWAGAPEFEGKAQVIGGTFTYTAIENLSALLGYSVVMNKDDGLGRDDGLASQNIEAFITYTMDKFSLAVYDRAILRSDKYGVDKDGELAADFANRFAIKASYAVNDKLTPSVRVNHYIGYTGVAMWGGLGIVPYVTADGADVVPVSRIVIEPKVDYNLGGGIGAYFGLVYEKILTAGVESDMSDTWRLPLGFTVTF